MSSKYVDSSAVVQVLGSLYNNPKLLDNDDKYFFSVEDFPERFHKIIFRVIVKLKEQGVEKLDLQVVNDFLERREKSKRVYEANQGDKYLLSISKNANSSAFDYYYDRLKKFSLLRAYNENVIDVSFLYDVDNILDEKKKQEQEEWLDSTTLEAIALAVDDRIEEIKSNHIHNIYDDTQKAGNGIFDLISKYEETPAVGVPLYGNLINTVTRGARLGKMFLRSSPSGVSKTRTMIADFCNIGCDTIYEPNQGWISVGMKIPTVYIATEQDLEEIQTMMLAFVSGVNEEHILMARYEENEKERVLKAAEIIANSPLYTVTVPDFNLTEIELKIKSIIREKNVHYIFFDYIQTTLKILEEITKRSNGVRLREDNVLFMMTTKLKDICTKYNVFILSSTQISGDFKNSDSPDQTLLRGARSQADKIDIGLITLRATNNDQENLRSIIDTGIYSMPDMKISVYKNRQGKYKGIYLWCKSDLGTCRVNPMFATTWNYELIEMKDLKIEVEENKETFLRRIK